MTKDHSHTWNPRGNHCPEIADQISPRYWNIHTEEKDYPALDSGRLLISHLMISRAPDENWAPACCLLASSVVKKWKSVVHRTAEEVLQIPTEKSAHCNDSILLLIPPPPSHLTPPWENLRDQIVQIFRKISTYYKRLFLIYKEKRNNWFKTGHCSHANTIPCTPYVCYWAK